MEGRAADTAGEDPAMGSELPEAAFRAQLGKLREAENRASALLRLQQRPPELPILDQPLRMCSDDANSSAAKRMEAAFRVPWRVRYGKHLRQQRAQRKQLLRQAAAQPEEQPEVADAASTNSRQAASKVTLLRQLQEAARQQELQREQSLQQVRQQQWQRELQARRLQRLREMRLQPQQLSLAEEVQIQKQQRRQQYLERRAELRRLQQQQLLLQQPAAAPNMLYEFVAKLPQISAAHPLAARASSLVYLLSDLPGEEPLPLSLCHGFLIGGGTTRYRPVARIRGSDPLRVVLVPVAAGITPEGTVHVRPGVRQLLPAQKSAASWEQIARPTEERQMEKGEERTEEGIKLEVEEPLGLVKEEPVDEIKIEPEDEI